MRLRVVARAGLGEFLHARNCALWAGLRARRSACAVLLGRSTAKSEKLNGKKWASLESKGPWSGLGGKRP